MAIQSDGTQAFGIEASPVTINAITYVCEGLSFGYEGENKVIMDSNGEPIGATQVPGLTTLSGTLQLATDSTAPNVRGEEMVLTGTRNDATYRIISATEAETQGDYVKVSFEAYAQIN